MSTRASTNLVLMAGSGKRFVDAGYATSKPLLPVGGKPMIVQAVNSMPLASTWIFVIRKEHLAETEVINTLRSVAKDVHILVDPHPCGQLLSALVTKEHIAKCETLFIGACDLGMVYDRKKYELLISLQHSSNSTHNKMDSLPDVIAWSFTKQPNLLRNPHAWGWLTVDTQHNVHGVSVKAPISSDPYNDYAITGSFTFKSGRLFLELADALCQSGMRVNGEYYIDSMISIALMRGYRVVSFPINRYIGWGTPADYEEYIYKENAIKHARDNPSITDKKE